jgi:ribonuclease HI
MKNKYYVVTIGRKPGVYESWFECEKQIKNYPGAEHKSFSSVEEATEYLDEEIGIYNPKTRRFEKFIY